VLEKLNYTLERRAMQKDEEVVLYRLSRADLGSGDERVRRLFDHLVGGDQQYVRYRHPECLGGFEIDDEFEFGRLLNGQVEIRHARA